MSRVRPTRLSTGDEISAEHPEGAGEAARSAVRRRVGAVERVPAAGGSRRGRADEQGLQQDDHGDDHGRRSRSWGAGCAASPGRRRRRSPRGSAAAAARRRAWQPSGASRDRGGALPSSGLRQPGPPHPGWPGRTGRRRIGRLSRPVAGRPSPVSPPARLGRREGRLVTHRPPSLPVLAPGPRYVGRHPSMRYPPATQDARVAARATGGDTGAVEPVLPVCAFTG